MATVTESDLSCHGLTMTTVTESDLLSHGLTMTTVTESDLLCHGLTMTTVSEGGRHDTELLMQQGFWCWLETIRCKKRTVSAESSYNRNS